MNKNNILSPVSGVVKAIDIIDDIYRIYCDTGFLDSSILLAPVDGEYSVVSHNYGINLSSDTYKSKFLNEHAIIRFPNITLNLLVSVCSSKIKLEQNKQLTQCEKFGKFKNGTVIIDINRDINLSIQIADKIKAGQTIIGQKNG